MGRSGLRIAPLGIGTAGWATRTSVEEAGAILRTFLGSEAASYAGVLLDTSPAYGAGNAEPAAGRVLRRLPSHLRERLVISSAAGVDPLAPVGRRVDCSRRHLLSQLEHTLRNLGVDHLDLWSVGYFDQAAPAEEVAATLDQAIAQGKARYVGVRDHAGWQLAVAAGQDRNVIAAQAEYSLLVRGAEEHLLQAIGYLGTGFIAAAPLAHGVLAGKDGAQLRADAHPLLDERTPTVVEALRTAAAGLEIPPAAAALAWVAQRPQVTAVIVGPATAAQATELVACGQTRLPAAITRALDDVSA